VPPPPSRAPNDEETEAEPSLTYRVMTRRPRPRLAWVDDKGEHTVEIDRPILVGSSDRVQAILEDRMVSRLHAELEPREDGVWIRDLGSKNGTWVEGVRVQVAQVSDGARVRVGGSTLVVTYDRDPRKVPLWPSDRLGSMVAASEVMRELFQRASQYAQTDAPVLVTGETGTGKELLAQAIHELSARAEGPFVVVDCAALTDTLLESELFGHVRGAFTDAVSTRVGAIEAAHGGTVFLDEIGELPAAMQPKLLRVLETSQVRRVGEVTFRQVDVRFVAATHRDLARMVGAGVFREDLYFRLAVLPANVPALRERPGDVPLLVEHFASRYPGLAFDPAAMERLASYAWLGNVRELRNFVERARALGPARALAMLEGTEAPASRPTVPPPPAPLAALPFPEVPLDRPFKELREAYIDHLEREYIKGIILRVGRNASAVATAAGLDRTYVHRLMRKHDL
jgi:transcriptional regulator with GAF, ATPase, and Fis domain